MRATVSVSFEFMERAPVTWRGELIGIRPETIFYRAIKLARRELKPINWSSVVCVILERVDVTEAV